MFDGKDHRIKSLTVVLPVFNEERIIARSLNSLAETLSAICLDYEIIVVDDGSLDGTAAILDHLSARIAGLRVLRNICNQGLGAALQYGFREAGKELVFYTDSDMPFAYSDIIRAASLMERSGADVVTGYRSNRRMEGCLRRSCSITYNACVRLLYGSVWRDINCAFKLIKLSVLKQINLQARGSFIDAELMIKAKNIGCNIQELAVEYFPRQESDSRLFKFYPIVYGFWEMVRMYCAIRQLKRSAGTSQSQCG